MASCLGFYLNDKEEVIKYAKLVTDNNNNVQIEQYGTRFLKNGITAEKMISDIVQETGSQNIPISINPRGDIYVNFQVYNNAQGKGYADDVAKLEFEAWCEKNAKSPDRYSYTYVVSDLKTPENKYNAVMNIVEKTMVTKFSSFESVKISNMFPPQLVINRLVGAENDNYLLVDLNDRLSISVVLEGKLYEFKNYNIGMKQIISDYTLLLGSYQKAYEACKQMNVYSEGETNNNKQLEAIAEPILQEFLKTVAKVLAQNKKLVNKVLLTGVGTVFTNIDILFSEYLEIKCEILKPNFMKNTTDVRNLAEILETTQAVAVAYETLFPSNKNVEFIKASENVSEFKKKFNSLMEKFNSKIKDDKVLREKKLEEKKKKEENLSGEELEAIEQKYHKIFNWTGSAAIIAFIAVASYITFSAVYVGKIENLIKEVDAQTASLKEQTEEVNTDINYVAANTKQYTTINNHVQTVVQQIERNQIGKFTTYNVATFLQNILNVVPTKVQMNSLSSDDNKNVTIVAQSDSYAELGYFVAELKNKKVLNSPKIINIKNGSTIVVEIGGELP